MGIYTCNFSRNTCNIPCKIPCKDMSLLQNIKYNVKSFTALSLLFCILTCNWPVFLIHKALITIQVDDIFRFVFLFLEKIT